MRRRLLFHRDFRGYTGGHGKVWDYFGHAGAHPGWSAALYLTPDSVADGNPWLACPVAVERRWDPARADALFLGGLDWAAYPEDMPARPVINLVQHVRHADPALPLRAFLGRRAIRICVSAEVADAILATGEVNGPVRVIEAAVRLPPVQHPVRRGGVFIGALKQPALGQALAIRLRARGMQVDIADTLLPRERYLARLAASSTAVLLPHATEGFYLPALEAMALGCAVIVPDCVGNRAYLRPGRNALAPPPQVDALDAAVASLEDPDVRRILAAAGRHTASRFSPDVERAAFHAILDDLDSLWLA